METQQELNRPIGTIEPEKREVLEPKKVKILSVRLRTSKKGDVLECESKHPDKEESIKISSVSILKDKQVKTSGLWFTMDKEENIQKGSALAVFLQKVGVSTPKELEGKEIETELDDAKWLCFKAY